MIVLVTAIVIALMIAVVIGSKNRKSVSADSESISTYQETSERKADKISPVFVPADNLSSDARTLSLSETILPTATINTPPNRDPPNSSTFSEMLMSLNISLDNNKNLEDSTPTEHISIPNQENDLPVEMMAPAGAVNISTLDQVKEEEHLTPISDVTAGIPSPVEKIELDPISLSSIDDPEILEPAPANPQKLEKDPSVINVAAMGQKIDYGDLDNNLEEHASSKISSYNPSTYEGYSIDLNRLGTRLKDTLGLTNLEKDWLNSFWNYENVFTGIKGCCIEVAKVYIYIIHSLEKELIKKNTSFEIETEFFIEQINTLIKSRATYYYSDDNAYFIGLAKSDFFSTIFKRAENRVREAYDHKRKVSDDFPHTGLMPEFENRIGVVVNSLLAGPDILIKPPTPGIEIALNEINTTRWKRSFEILANSLKKENVPRFIRGVLKLEKLNEKNPSIENIFFEASKSLAKFDRIESLKFYIKYIHYDLISEKIDRKAHNKTIQKSLFQTTGQLKEFTEIITELVTKRDVDTALTAVEQLYTPKRKKISLDLKEIAEVEKQDSQTVDILSSYLEDDISVEVPKEEINIQIPNPEKKNSIFSGKLNLNLNQETMLLLFKEHDLHLDPNELRNFCLEKGLFNESFVESINSACFDYLDDLLIEQSDLNYSINPEYFKKITDHD